MLFAFILSLTFAYADTLSDNDAKDFFYNNFGDFIGNLNFLNPEEQYINAGHYPFCILNTFYKTGTITNITMPQRYEASSHVRFYVTQTGGSGSVYQSAELLKSFPIRTYGWYGISGFPSFNVTANQSLYFCANWTNVAGNVYLIVQKNNTYSPNMTNYLNQFYPNYNTFKNIDNRHQRFIYGLRNDSHVKLSGYVYSDGEAVFMNYDETATTAGFIVSGTGKIGQRFQYDDATTKINSYGLIFRDHYSVSYPNIPHARIYLYNFDLNSEIHSCNISNTSISQNTFQLHYCNSSNDDLYLSTGEYGVMLECWQDAGHSIPCTSTPHTGLLLVQSRPFLVTGAGGYDFPDEWQDQIGYQSNSSYFYTELTATYQNPNPSDIFFYLNYEINETFVAECNDLIDNDADGFVDLLDPSCYSTEDNFESPYDITACNDGIDNDNDGFIDLADPRCPSLIYNTEFPNDANTTQPDSTCLVEDFCILKEQVPYTDDINRHRWTGNLSNIQSYYFSGISNMIYFDNNNDDFNAILPIYNPNIYNEVRLDFDLYHSILENDGDSTIYMALTDNNGRYVVLLKYYLVNVLNTYGYEILLYNGTGYEIIKQGYFDVDEDLHRATITFDQTERTFTYSYVNGGQYIDLGTFDWTDILAFRIENIEFSSTNSEFDNSVIDFAVDNINMIGNDVELTTTCDLYSSPYYLIETFNGYLRNCEWYTSSNIFTTSRLSLTTATTDFYATKLLGKTYIPTGTNTQTNTTTYNILQAEASKTNYVTSEFDLSVTQVLSNGEITFSLLDHHDFQFLSISIKDNESIILYNNNQVMTTAYSGLTAGEHNIKIVFGFQADKFDLYVDNIEVASDLSLANRLYNAEFIASTQIRARNAEFYLDNLQIYSSDSTGSEQLPTETPVVQPKYPTDYMCGLFQKETESCTTDADCITGKCNYAGKCSSFDYTYCDENGKTRGTSCILSGVTKCGLTTLADIIFDNMILFLVFIIVVIGVLYVVMFFRRG